MDTAISPAFPIRISYSIVYMCKIYKYNKNLTLTPPYCPQTSIAGCLYAVWAPGTAEKFLPERAQIHSLLVAGVFLGQWELVFNTFEKQWQCLLRSAVPWSLSAVSNSIPPNPLTDHPTLIFPQFSLMAKKPSTWEKGCAFIEGVPISPLYLVFTCEAQLPESSDFCENLCFNLKRKFLAILAVQKYF